MEADYSKEKKKYVYLQSLASSTSRAQRAMRSWWLAPIISRSLQFNGDIHCAMTKFSESSTGALQMLQMEFESLFQKV